MDSLGDYIYLILLVLAGVGSLLKKKKVNTEPKKTEAEPETDWEDVLRELIPQEEPELKTETPIGAVNKTPEPTISYDTIDDTSKLRARKQVSSSIKQKKQTNNEIKNTQEDISDESIQFSSTDDAKRAFIYSEIFNKKY